MTTDVKREKTVEGLRMLIGGRWVESGGGETFEAFNPATGRVIATLPKGTREDARLAVAEARKAQPRLASMSVWERSKMLLAIADVMEARREELARTLTEDQGKPFWSEALFEVGKAIEGFRNAAEHVKWLEGETIRVEDPRKRVFTIYQPRGVYAVVTPWNFPMNIPVEYLAPGLAAGNAIVWVPAPTTSVCAVKLMECLVEAGLPEGIVNLVTGPGDVVGDEIVGHPDVDAVGFTGSAATGVHIARRAAGKPCLLEMGGNGPVIVLDDADIEKAIAATCGGSFSNAGQICSSSERVLVGHRIYEEFAERAVEAARNVRLGDPFDKESSMGPLNNPGVAQKVAEHLADSVDRGASVMFGGRSRGDLGSSLFFEPTVLSDVSLDSRLNLEETFGPVVPLIRVSSDEEMLEIANRNTFGLVASVFTQDINRAYYFAEGIKTGTVNVNDASTYWELHVPFGGASGKFSGVGRVGGKYALREMSDLKTISIDLG
ncbi:MAG TPA: aldehyde dehydrogenase family protein [Trueperaceae bacterium]